MNDLYRCVPLTSDIHHLKEIEDFTVDRESDVSGIKDEIIGLEAYLKRCAWDDDSNGEVKIYLIKDTLTNDIAAYFGLKAGMVIDNEYGMPSEEDKKEALAELNVKLVSAVTPGIEISHFAVNDNYRRKAGKNGTAVRGLGNYFYPAFIYPIIRDVSERIGVRMIYLYAAGDDHLVNYYKEVFKFNESDLNDFYMPLQPGYDGGCKFMYQIIS